MTDHDLHAALRTWSTSTRSAGIVAGVELMIQAELVDPEHPWVVVDAKGAWLNFPAIDRGDLIPADLAVARIAASLAGWNKVLLSYLIEDLGYRKTQLVLAAIAAAAGYAAPTAGMELGEHPRRAERPALATWPR